MNPDLTIDQAWHNIMVCTDEYSCDKKTRDIIEQSKAMVRECIDRCKKLDTPNPGVGATANATATPETQPAQAQTVQDQTSSANPPTTA